MQPQDFGSWFAGVCVAALCCGCAHNHGNNYAYAPPYAPPVYPQPGAVAQPVAYTAPVAAGPVVGAPGAVVGAPGAVMGAPGPVVAGHSTPCPQACPDGTVVGTPVVVEGGGQTPPCPPGS
jgi:hypothetical protein